MSTAWLVLLESLLFAFHCVLIIFNMTGWIWRRTRRLHRVAVGLMTFSWFVMGAYHGWGYCVCTDWHFRVRRALGEPVVESSFVQHLARRLAGVALSRHVADRTAIAVYFGIVAATLVVWVRDRRRTATSAPEPDLTSAPIVEEFP